MQLDGDLNLLPSDRMVQRGITWRILGLLRRLIGSWDGVLMTMLIGRMGSPWKIYGPETSMKLVRMRTTGFWIESLMGGLRRLELLRMLYWEIL